MCISDCPYLTELLLKEIFAPSGSKFFPLREVPIEKGRYCRESLSDIVACL